MPESSDDSRKNNDLPPTRLGLRETLSKAVSSIEVGVRRLVDRPPIMRGKEIPHQWRAHGFDPITAINNTPGLLIEIAGPSPSGYESIDISALNRDPYPSNIAPGYPTWDDQTGEQYNVRDANTGERAYPASDPADTTRLIIPEKIQFQADATRLPITDSSVAALFVRCLEGDLVGSAIKEAYRVIRDGGFFIGERLTLEGIRYAHALGFDIKQYSGSADTTGRVIWNYILQKPLKNKA